MGQKSRDQGIKGWLVSKKIILNEFTRLTGYNRCYATQLLQQSKVLGYAHTAGQTIK